MCECVYVVCRYGVSSGCALWRVFWMRVCHYILYGVCVIIFCSSMSECKRERMYMYVCVYVCVCCVRVRCASRYQCVRECVKKRGCGCVYTCRFGWLWLWCVFYMCVVACVVDHFARYHVSLHFAAVCQSVEERGCVCVEKRGSRSGKYTISITITTHIHTPTSSY